MKPFLHTPQLKKSNITNPTCRRNLPWKLRCVAWMAFLLLARGTNAQTWTLQTSNTTNNLNDIWGIDANNIWTVGFSVFKYDGTSWSTVNTGMANGNILSIWGKDASHIWVNISTGAGILFYNGNTWTTQFSGLTNESIGLGGFNASNVWSAGSPGSIRKYDGTSWTLQSSPTSSALRGVWCADAFNAWAVGVGSILKYNGVSWTTQSNPSPYILYDIWGTSASNIWAVGGGGTIVKYDGVSWTVQSSPTTNQLNAVWGTDANNIWAVGNFGTILKYNGSTWQSQNSGTTAKLTGVWGTGSKMWVTGASGTILYSTDQPLPVELSTFQARLQADQTTLLHWQTATEHNNTGFDIERSNDGKNWEKIGFVPGHGNSQEQRTYQFIDPRPLPGNNFYRLVQVDADGSATYSDIKSVVLADDNKPGFHVFPNPVTQGSLTLQLSDEPDENASLRIYSDAGHLLLQQPVQSSVQQADMNGWAPGTYMIEVNNAGTTWRKHVVLGQ